VSAIYARPDGRLTAGDPPSILIVAWSGLVGEDFT
jgi:hypothetical protein